MNNIVFICSQTANIIYLSILAHRIWTPIRSTTQFLQSDQYFNNSTEFFKEILQFSQRKVKRWTQTVEDGCVKLNIGAQIQIVVWLQSSWPTLLLGNPNHAHDATAQCFLQDLWVFSHSDCFFFLFHGNLGHCIIVMIVIFSPFRKRFGYNGSTRKWPEHHGYNNDIDSSAACIGINFYLTICVLLFMILKIFSNKIVFCKIPNTLDKNAKFGMFSFENRQ